MVNLDLNRLIVVSPNPNLLLLVQLISPLADTFDMFLIQSGILARGVEVEAMDVSVCMLGLVDSGLAIVSTFEIC